MTWARAFLLRCWILRHDYNGVNDDRTASCFAVCFCAVVGCGGDEPFRKATSPVKGKVTVNGAAPGSEIQMECHPVNGMDTQHPTASQAAVDAEGNFSISTYEAGDGIPAGDYVLVFLEGL